jgi:predicted membrane chloride channel (bestrophin family)
MFDVDIATSYNAYWEGRKLIGAMNTEIRNLSRLLWVTVPEEYEADHIDKCNHIKMALGFAYAARHALLDQSGVFQDFENLIPDDIILDDGPHDIMPLPYQIAYKVVPR